MFIVKRKNVFLNLEKIFTLPFCILIKGDLTHC
jgi:hypothetical protein